MTVAELLTFLIHQDQSKEVWIVREDWSWKQLESASKTPDGDVSLVSRD